MYKPPLKDFRFLLHQVLNVGQLQSLPRHADFSAELADSVLEEAGKFSVAEFDLNNTEGDRVGAQWRDGAVTLPASLKATYKRFVEAGWPGLAVPAAQGGQGMPLAVGYACDELWFGGNVALMLCPQLTRGAIEALAQHATPALWERFGPPLASGEWTGTMNLTESQAGSDLAAIRTRAVAEGDHYRIHGQKIFITWGEHDLTPNIVHLVLARIDGAPAGVKGISMFVVPKFLPDAAGKPGTQNDVRCVSIEHKLGIHASPTCVMAYGDTDGAIGYLVGEPNRGLEYMFVMMNAARLGVGIQGIGLAERGFQQALGWARNRVQGRPPGAAPGEKQTIDHHPDVKRMLLAQKSGVEAMRGLALYTALQLDLAHGLEDQAQAQQALLRAELLIPIVKAWSTEFGAELISLAMQVHGGMGYIEETGVAQTLRDVRITAIYEGTTGIQANDLLGRKLARDQGATMLALLEEIAAEMRSAGGGGPAADSMHVAEAAAQLRVETQHLLAAFTRAPADGLAVAVPYLMQCGFVLGGWLMQRAAVKAAAALVSSPGDTYLSGKLETAAFFVAHHLPRTLVYAAEVERGAKSVAGARPELMAASLE